MYKVVFFEHEETKERIPIKCLCKREDSKEEINKKAFNILLDLFEAEEAIEYSLVEIKDLKD